MRIVRDHLTVPAEDRGAAVAIGNFDGVHLGHQAVIGLASDAAAGSGAPTGVLTFEPHPREFFAPDAPPFRLMNAGARAHRLEKLGIDLLYELPFGAPLASLTPRAFAEEILTNGIGASHVVVGSDFCFGRGRAGTAKDLAAFGKELGFGVTIAPLLETGGVEVSSTRIREALTEGRPQDVARMLGHLHRIEGEVVKGDQRGRDLGFPTANMSISGLHPPCYGIYAVRMSVLTGPHSGDYNGVASVGTRPTFGDHIPNLEVFVFDFSGDLYGETLSVALVDYLRGEEKFENVDALIAQMNDDSDRARAILG